MLLKTKFVPKPWGYEKWLVNNDKYCGKILFVAKYKYCSYHYHKIKEETFYILKGKIKLLYGGRKDDDNNWVSSINWCNNITLSSGDSFHIPVGMPHRFIAIEDSEIIEISTHHEDSDSIRILPSCDYD